MAETPSVADILEQAAELLSMPGAWTQGTYARTKTGRKTKTRRYAVCFCAIGAIDFASGDTPGSEHNYAAMNALGALVPGGVWRIADWNDAPDRTQGQVVSKFKEAAGFARAAQVRA